MTQKNRQKKSIKLYSGALLVQGFMSLILAFNNMLLANNLDVQNMSDFSTIAQAVTQYIKHLFVFYIYNFYVKFVFLYVDFVQVIVNKLAGLNKMGETGITLDSPLFKFALSDIVLKVFLTICIFAIVLLVIFTIIAIIKSEYQVATDQVGFDNKKGKGIQGSTSYALRRAGLAGFLMLFVPVILLVSTVFVSVVLNSTVNALNINGARTTLGGQVFLASSYDANKYRIYAQNNKRIPTVIDFDDPSDNGYYTLYSAEELLDIYNSWTDGKDIYNMFAGNTFPSFNDTLVYKNNKLYNKSQNYGKYESYTSSAEQYFVMADFLDYAMSNEITYHYKSILDNNIDWDFDYGNGVKISGATWDEKTGTLTITYKDYYGLTDYYDGYYTVEYNSGLANASTPIEDAIKTLDTILGLGENDGKIFRVLEQVEGSINVVRYATEYAEYDGQNYTVYELTKIIKNQNSGLNEERFSTLVAKKSDSVSAPFYVLKDEKGSDGFYDYTNVTIDYFNDGNNYFDKLEPVYKYVTWPEKLYNDIKIIYRDIDIDNYINYDNWADQLSEIYNGSNTITSEDVASFSTTLIHPIGLLISEMMLGTTFEPDPYTSYNNFDFASVYSADTISALIKAVGGQYEYKNIKGQIDYFVEIFNATMTPIINTLQTYENFEVFGTDPESVRLYIYRAYLSSIMMGEDFGDFIAGTAYLVENISNLISTITYSANAQIYDGEYPLYKKDYNLDINGNRIPIVYNYSVYEDVRQNKLVYNSNGVQVPTANEQGRLDSLGKYIPREDVSYEIRNGEYYILIPSLHKYVSFNSILNYSNLNWLDYFKPFYTIIDNVAYVYDTKNAYLPDVELVVMTDQYGDQIEYNEFNNFYENYFLYHYTAVPVTYDQYVAYEQLTPAFKKMIDDAIIYIEDYLETNHSIQEPKFLQVLKDYKNGTEEMKSVLKAETIKDKDAKKLEEEYDELITKIDTLKQKQSLSSSEKKQLTKLQDKLYKLKKYWLVYGLNMYLTTRVGSTMTIVANGNSFSVPLNMPLQKFMEFVLGNKLNRTTAINSIKNGTRYEALSEYDKSIVQNQYCLVRIYAEEIQKISEALSLNSEQFKILNMFVNAICGTNYNFDNKSFLDMKLYNNSNYQYIVGEVQKACTDLPKMYQNYIDGKHLNNGLLYAFSESECFDIIATILEIDNPYTNLEHVDSDYEGIIDDNGVVFGQLKTFLQDFGNYCFDISKKSNFIDLTNPDTENILDYADVLSSIITESLKNVNIGSEELAPVYFTKDEFIADICKPELSELGFYDLDAVYKNYVIVVRDYYEKLIEDFENRLKTATVTADTILNFINGRYTLVANSAIYTTFVKEYLSYFKNNVNINDVDFYKKYVYNGYQLSEAEMNKPEYLNEKINYYNNYVTAFSNLKFSGDSGYYFSDLNAFQQKVLIDAYSFFYQKAEYLKNPVSTDHLEYLYNIDKHTAIKDYIINSVIKETDQNDDQENSVQGSALNTTDDSIAGARFIDIRQILIDSTNIKMLQLTNLLDFIGIEFSAYKTLTDYRLEAMKNLEDFKEYVGESGASVQKRYLANLYLFCAGYETDAIGRKNLIVSDYAKQIILSLAGMSNRPEELLVGLQYEVDFSSYRRDERYGDAFIICTFNEETQLYVPFIFATGANDIGVPVSSSYVSTLKNEETGEVLVDYFPVIGKGCFDDNGYPTIIREVNGITEFYRITPNLVDVEEIGLDKYYVSAGETSTNFGLISTITNTVTKLLTGKTLASIIYEQVPRFTLNSEFALCYGTKTDCVYHVDTCGITLNYMFYHDTGIASDYIYQMSNLNIIVLLLGSTILVSGLTSMMWGLIKVIFELICLFLVSPAIFATYPLQDGPTEKLKNGFIRKLFATYGYVITLNLFFVMVALVSKQGDFFTADSPAIKSLQSNLAFQNLTVDFFNYVARVLFFLGTIVIISTMPKTFAKLIGLDGADEITGVGKSTREDVVQNITTTQDLASGQAAIDKVNSMKNTVSNFMPPIAKRAGKVAKGIVKAPFDLIKQKQEQDKIDAFASRMRAAGVSEEAINNAIKQYQDSMNEIKKAKEGQKKGAATRLADRNKTRSARAKAVLKKRKGVEKAEKKYEKKRKKSADKVKKYDQKQREKNYK